MLVPDGHAQRLTSCWLDQGFCFARGRFVDPRLFKVIRVTVQNNQYASLTPPSPQFLPPHETVQAFPLPFSGEDAGWINK